MAELLTAGSLDQRITFLIPAVAVNAFNEPVEIMTTFSEVWAKRSDMSTSEAIRAQEVGAELTARFTVRWSTESAQVDPSFRIRHRGEEFNIIGTREIGRREWLEVDAVARNDRSAQQLPGLGYWDDNGTWVDLTNWADA